MAKIKPAAFITEIRNNIAENDAVKAAVVLSHLAEMDLEVQKQALELFRLSSAEFAIPLLALVLDRFPYLTDSLPEFKELLVARILEVPAIYLEFLQDSRVNCRGFLIDLAGEMGFDDAYQVLMAMLVNEKDHDIIERVVRALGDIGDVGAVSNIAELLYTEDDVLVETAIQALGRLGSSTAMQRLDEKLGREKRFDSAILEVFSAVQSREALEKLNKTLTSQYAHIRSAGKEKLVALGSKVVPLLSENLRYNDPDLLIHTLNVLGEIGDEGAIAPIRKLLHQQPQDANVRFAAYETLGRLPLTKGAYALASGLHDPVANVRSAAAAAIDRNYNEILAAGLKNMVRPGDREAQGLVQTIITTQSGNIFLDLLELDFFREQAFRYLTQKAHADTLEFFRNVLQANGYVSEAEELGNVSPGIAAGKTVKKVVAIDDSKMILGIYRSMLHVLGYEPYVFMDPESAVVEVCRLKPDAVLTDLNMPGITGIEVTRRLRRTFSKSELPILMVTTQNDNHDNEAAKEAGVNEILHKPFTQESIGVALARYLG
ncbi:MAG TPA: response regulator [Proteobacteria bacterium]|nr:response regulator [Pseudomonadota bacterium]